LPADHCQRRPSTRSSPSRSARFPASPRVHDWRPAKALGPRPGRSGEARRQGPVARGTSGGQISIVTVDSPKGNIDGDKTRLYDLLPTTRCWTPRTGTDVNRCLSQWWARCGFRDIGQAVTGPEDCQAGGLGRRQTRRVSWWYTSSPAPTSIDTVDKIKALLPRARGRHFRPRSRLVFSATEPKTIRAAVEGRFNSTLLLTIVLVVMVIFVFLRSFWATVIPAITVPLGSARRLRV